MSRPLGLCSTSMPHAEQGSVPPGRTSAQIAGPHGCLARRNPLQQSEGNGPVSRPLAQPLTQRTHCLLPMLRGGTPTAGGGRGPGRRGTSRVPCHCLTQGRAIHLLGPLAEVALGRLHARPPGNFLARLAHTEGTETPAPASPAPPPMSAAPPAAPAASSSCATL